MLEKKFKLTILLIVIPIIILILPIAVMAYSIFLVPEYVKIVAVFEDGTFKMATEPNNLLPINKKLSRFTNVYFNLENHTKQTCQGLVKAKRLDDSLNLEPEAGYTNFLPKGEKVNIELCGKKMELDLTKAK